MYYKLLECNYLVYLDILKKNKIDKHYIKTIELINKLIKKYYVNESYCLIRLLFEEIMYDLALKIDSAFPITIKTSPKKIRDFVTEKREALFGDLYEEKYFDSIYETLSKMSHETTLKKFVNDIIKNKDSKEFVKSNQMSMFLTVTHILVVSTTSNPELIELSNYLVYASNKIVLLPATIFNNELSTKEREKYDNYFCDEKDKEYMNDKYNETLELLKSIDTDDIKSIQNKVAGRLQVLLKKYGYDKVFNKL